jgi:CRP-like cAMP-binding protein
MFDVLFKYFEDKSGIILSEENRQMIEGAFRPKKLRKKQYLLQEGDVCKYVGFIVKGSARMFSIDDKGHEHIVRFGTEGWWIADSESHLLGLPSKYNIEVLEDTDLLLVTNDVYQQLLNNIPAVAAATKAIDKQSFITSQKRIHAAISMTAEERFEDLMNAYPDFIQRFSQNMIASYLGISPETLSRIRKSRADKR